MFCTKIAFGETIDFIWSEYDRRCQSSYFIPVLFRFLNFLKKLSEYKIYKVYKIYKKLIMINGMEMIFRLREKDLRRLFFHMKTKFTSFI